MAPCYASSAKQYRHQMGGGPEAAELPAPKDPGIEKWGNVSKSFDKMVTDIQDTLRAAEAAHEGRAADAANASIAEIAPHATAAANTARGVKGALEEQVGYQKEAFHSIPAQGDTLENGRGVQLDPPEKGWMENGGWDKTWYLGWASDYEERQQDFVSTNERANAAMERYQGQTEGVIARMPEFKPVEQPPPPPQQPPGTGMPSADSQMAGTSMSSPASSSSAWAGGSTGGGGGHVATSTPSHTPPPAQSTPSWATTPPNNGLPPGVVRGPDGTLYRQGPNGWERQNPYNGRWAPSPQGGPGGRGPGGPGAPAAGGGRGGMGGGRGFGPGAGGQLGAGGRAGVGGFGGSAAGGGAPGGAAGGARGGGAPMGGAGGAGRGNQQEGDEQQHERPGWLTETEDVFTNDMEKVAPPVFGDANPGEGR
ncbi:hypothetical protein HUO13_05790 [Saccharopolyspora erythraea]|uniref:hypothetical protein n=1 Tax=Saccharopolyspora erythraea TaxID=1836 RepID=UPI001BAB3D15|nr:hypothetical protein [Saccharopolyspora erythraea]QUH00393.1 hypothetical protein HUO13_05790 [Saccharopolyspora erythraea]